MESYGMIYMLILMVTMVIMGRLIGLTEGRKQGFDSGYEKGRCYERDQTNKTISFMRVKYGIDLEDIKAMKLYEKERA